ncbi:hypothetical protein [Microtetraspora malaysiensis]|uniref:hypothetical protein n=1 Tax=Microtetraspora malaysiensis TaxID=161358 RepID=UPI00082C6AF7|nr:hypothetical protein [Microtetraspora malaysiensis]
MSSQSSHDLRLTPDGWQPTDVLADYPDGDDSYLISQGWEPFIIIGDPDSDMCLQSWRRPAAGGEEYLLKCGICREARRSCWWRVCRG